MYARAVRVGISERGAETIHADVLIALVRGPAQRANLPLAEHLRDGAERLITWRSEAMTWLETRGLPCPRVLVYCLPAAHQFDPDLEYLGGFAGSYDPAAAQLGLERALRCAGAQLERACNGAGIRHAALVAWPTDCDGALIVEGMLLRAHDPRAWERSADGPTATSLRRLTVCMANGAMELLDKRERRAWIETLRERLKIVDATNFARELGDLPGNVGTAAAIVERTRERIATDNLPLELRTVSAAQAAERGMGLFVAVDAGARERGCILELRHRSDDERPPIVFVGKGLTHDTGGYNLKRGPSVHYLTHDKCGAAAVIGAMLAISALGVDYPVVGWCPLTENNIDACAYKPGDILRACNGTTVYVENTDAEGRLVLADVLAWIAEHEPRPELVIDLATLTAEVHAALGDPFAALYCNEDRAREQLMVAGRASGDLLWPMPIHDVHDQNLGHHKADVRNIGVLGGAPSSAAAFLRGFVDYPWAHIDLAGKSHAEFGRDCFGPGATGFGCRLLIEFVRRMGA